MSDKPRTWTLSWDHRAQHHYIRGTDRGVFEGISVIELEPVLDLLEAMKDPSKPFAESMDAIQALLRAHGRLS